MVPSTTPASADGVDGVGRLRLLSFNMQAGAQTRRYREYLTRSWQHLLPVPSKAENLRRLVPLLRDYDLVGLQEADAGSLRSGFVNQAEYLAEAAGFPFWSQQRNRKVGHLAHSSNSLLTRIRPTMVHDHPLPGRIPGRGALVAYFGQGVDPLMVVIAHLSLGPVSRAWQLDFLRELVGNHRHVLLMGDFNCELSHPSARRLLERSGLRPAVGERLPTYPSWRPQRAIDHVLVTPTLAVEQYATFAPAISDHLPVAVHLRLPEELRIER